VFAATGGLVASVMQEGVIRVSRTGG
jgi:acyl-CoA thioesterase